MRETRVKNSRAAGRSILVVLLLLTCAGKLHARAPRSSIVADIPIIEFSNGMFGVEGQLGSTKKAVFLIDLGSTITLLLDQSMSEAAHLPPVPTTLDMRIQGSSTSIQRPYRWVRGHLKHGGLTLADGVHPTSDLSGISSAVGIPIMGIIGLPVASRYVMDVDFDAKVLTLLKPETYQPPTLSHALHFRRGAVTSLIVIDGEVIPHAGKDRLNVSFCLDTGFDGDISFDQASPLKGATVTSKVELGMAALNSIDESIQQTMLEKVTLADLEFGSRRALYLEHASAGSLDKDCEAMVGMHLLKPYNFAVDLLHSFVYLYPRKSN